MLTALALATPIFGLVLVPPTGVPAFALTSAALAPPGIVLAQVGEAAHADAEEADAEASRQEEPSLGNLGEELRRRQSLAGVHRALGIATWGGMLATVALGVIQYYNLYGFFGGIEDTPCVQGDAIFGQEQCWGTPWPHRIAALATTGLYAVTFTISLIMPDPLDLSRQEGAFADRLRAHEALRWIHLIGMIAQIGLGLAVGQNWFGTDRANDFGTMQALATIHQGVGLVTFGTLTAAGLLML